jgi:hypothetical protein
MPDNNRIEQDHRGIKSRYGGQCVASAPLTQRLAFADVMMNSGTSCTPVTASTKPHQPPLVAVASFKQAASPFA